MMEAYRDPARCSYPLHPFLSKNVHSAPARVSEIFSYKLKIFSDGYASSKFIPHKIFLTEIYVNEKRVIMVYVTGSVKTCQIVDIIIMH